MNLKELMNSNNIQNQLTVEQLLLTDWKNQFNYLQLIEIKKGIYKNIEVSIYSKPFYSYLEMKQIRLGLEDGLDVSIYAKPELNWKQMKDIRLSLKDS